jgi:hypothetical protein
MEPLKLVDNFWISFRTAAIILFSVIASVAMAQENQAGSETILEQDKMPLNTFTVALAGLVSFVVGHPSRI